MGDRMIIDCHNLLGDTVYLIKPLRQFLASRQIERVAIGLRHGLPGEIVRRSFPGVRVGPVEVLEAAWPSASRIELSAKSAWEQTRNDNSHISQGYARILGIELAGGIEPDVSWLPPPVPTVRREHIALAPFSVSCASHRGGPPNKTINESDWLPLLDILRRYGWPLKVIGSPKERFSTQELGISEADYFSAGGIEDLVCFLRRSRLVVGVDNGVCHLSSCAGIPTTVLWSSAASLQFIGETWAPRTRILHIGSPARLDRRRVAGLLASAVEQFLGQEARAAASDPETPNRACGQLPSADGGAASTALTTTTGDPPVSASKRAAVPALHSLTFAPLRYGARGLRTRSGHLAFASDLVASLRPRLVVELGTYSGESYFGFCQAVAENGLPGTCYAVNTWLRSPHSLVSGEEVFEDVQQYNSERYASFSYLLRTSFDDALEWFSDGSIDLLHIDRPTTYEAAKHDFDAWYPKVAPNGMVLLHNIDSRHSDFGVRRLWEEISQAHDTFGFHHCEGLGVIRKPGGLPAREGILDSLFLAESAEPIRRYYVSCSDRLDLSADVAAADRFGQSAVLTDPAPDLVNVLTIPVGPDNERRWVELPLADTTLLRNDFRPLAQKPNTWCADTPDPWVVCSSDLDCSCFRFFVLTMSCSCAAPQPFTQLFWSGPHRHGFDERHSVRFPVIPDGEPHTYVVDLHAGAEPGTLNYLWWHRGSVDSIRIDPLDTPGEFTITLAGFAHQDAADVDYVRDGLHLWPVRNELSYRYLCGSGIEIGPLQSPLALRPDTHVRYADHLSLGDARASYPELNRLPLVSPTIICSPAALAPVAERSVDFVIANHVVEHVPKPLAALHEWLRVVRPGGYLYVAISEYEGPFEQVQPAAPREQLVTDIAQHRNRQELERLRYRLWGAGTPPGLPDTFNSDTFAGLISELIGRFQAELIELRRNSAGGVMEYIAILRKL